MLRVGVIGCGYWGPNLIRNFQIPQRSRVTACADLDALRLEHMRDLYPSLRVTQDAREICSDPENDAVAFATPVSTHHALALEALRHGKHVFVEKPLALSSDQCVEMAAAAQRQHRTLMVGHTFVYTAGRDPQGNLPSRLYRGRMHLSISVHG